MTLVILTRKWLDNKGYKVNPNLAPHIFSYCLVCKAYRNYYFMSIGNKSIEHICSGCNTTSHLITNFESYR